MTPSGIEPATFRFVAQHLNYCATAVPRQESTDMKLLHLGGGGEGAGGGKCHADGVSTYRHRVNIVWEPIRQICRWKLWRG